MSCSKSGSTLRSLWTAPPMCGRLSRTSTDHPASARRLAATRPFGPAPITTASYDGSMVASLPAFGQPGQPLQGLAVAELDRQRPRRCRHEPPGSRDQVLLDRHGGPGAMVLDPDHDLGSTARPRTGVQLEQPTFLG